jgi:aspartate ammonia-lyase
MRIEKDFIGEIEIPRDALYGIASHRARDNFPCRNTFSNGWYRALGMTKKACYLTMQDLFAKIQSQKNQKGSGEDEPKLKYNEISLPFQTLQG